MKNPTPKRNQNLTGETSLNFEVIGQSLDSESQNGDIGSQRKNSISKKEGKSAIKEPIELSGGYKMPKELYEKKKEQNQLKQLNAMKSQGESGQKKQSMSKQEREIFDKLNIKPIKNEVPVQDVDVLQERVRENYEHDEEVNDRVMQNLEYKVQDLHEKRYETLSQKENVEKHLTMLLIEKKEKLESLMGSKKGRPQNREEITNELNERYRQQKEIVERANYDYMLRSQLLDDIEHQGRDYPEEIVKTYIQKIEVKKGQTTLDECDQVLDVHRNYVNELKEQYLKQRLEEQNEHQKILQQEKKKKQGIVSKVVTVQEKEQMEFQKQFKEFVKQRKNNEIKDKISRQYLQKDFQTYQALSPNIQRAQNATPKALYKDSSLISMEQSKQRSPSPRTLQLYQSLGYSMSEAEKSNIRGTQSKINKYKSDRELVNNQEMIDAKSEYFKSNGFEKNSFQAPKESHSREKKQVEQVEIAQKSKKSINDIQKELNILEIFFERTYNLNQKKDPQKIKAVYEDLYTQQIDKLDMIKALLKQSELMEYYNLATQTLNEEMIQFNTKEQSKIQFEQFVDFLQLERQELKKKQVNNYFADELGKSNLFQEQASEAIQGGCLLNDEHLNLFKNVFQKVDLYNDLVVKRQEYIEKLRSDIRVVHIMHLPAVYLTSINKTLSVQRVIYRMEQEQMIGDEIERKGQEFLTWGQVMEYLTNQNEEDNDRDPEGEKLQQAPKKGELSDVEAEQMKLMKLYSSIKENMDDSDNIDLDGKMKEIIEETYEKLKKYQNSYVQSTEFIEEIQLHQAYPYTCQQIARFQALQGTLQDESLEEVIDRMEKECDEFIDWNEIMNYFSRYGRPKSQVQEKEHTEVRFKQRHHSARKGSEDMENSQVSNLRENSKQKIRDEQEESIIDGYDSDPQMHTYTRGVMPKKASHLFKTQNAIDSSINRIVKRTRIEEDFPDDFQIPDNKSGVNFKLDNEELYQIDPKRSLSEQRVNYYNRILNKKRNRSESQDEGEQQLKITQPIPFEFDQRDKLGLLRENSIYARQMKEMEEEVRMQKESEYQKRFKPQQIPESVKNRDLLKQIMKAQEERREMVRQNSVAITIMNEKPFSFYERDQEKAKRKTNYEREKFVFKAKEIPAHVSMRLLERQNEEEQYQRKDKNAKHANWLMSISKLPPRMEKWEQQKKVKELAENMIGQSKTTYFDYSFEPPRAQPIPDFQKLQKTFQDNLDRKKKNQRPTQPTPFNFRESQKQESKESGSSTLNKKTAQEKLEEAKQWRDHKPEFMPGSTAKFDQQVKKLREEREKQAEDEAKRQKEEEDMAEKKKRIAPRVKQTQAEHRKKFDGEMKQKGKLLNFDEIQENRKIQMEERAQKWKNDKKKILQKAYDQPLLIERKTKRDQELQKMRMIDQLNKILDKNGVKDQDKPFTKEEREILKDIEYLRRAGFGDQFDKEDGDEDIKDALQVKKNKDQKEDYKKDYEKIKKKTSSAPIQEMEEGDKKIDDEIDKNINDFFTKKE